MIENNLIEKLKHFAAENKIRLFEKRVLLALSGGKDSVALAHLFHLLNVRFGIAHANFQLRGNESNEDETFAKNLAEQYNVPFYSTRFNINKNEENIQLTARNLRYDWFKQVADENKFHYMATAHHLTDAAETALFNFIKGTGIKGIRGILPNRDRIIRPLLFASQKDILDFVDSYKLPFREDSSNKSLEYTRNKIRHQILPIIKEINPAFEHTLQRQFSIYRALELDLEKKTNQQRKRFLIKRNEETFIPIRLLQKQKKPVDVLYELLLPFGFNIDQTKNIIDCLQAESGKVFFSEKFRLLKDRSFLILSNKDQNNFSSYLIQESDLELATSDAKITFHSLKKDDLQSLNAERNIAFIDKSTLTFPLILRHWKKGDYFYPFGMNGKKKKISKYFKDSKKSLNEKDSILILESDKKIVWVVNERLDNRFKVTDKSTEILKVQFFENKKG